MIWTLIALLLIFWLLGFGPLAAVGSVIHVLLVLIVVLFIWQLMTAGRPGGPPP